MKRLFITLMSLLITASVLTARDDEVIVTRQFTRGQRNSLPERTITAETKRLTLDKKADQELAAAITRVMDTIAQEDYQNRTFVLLVEPKADGVVSIAARNDDIVTRGRQDGSIYYGTLEHQRYYFVVLSSKENAQLLERTFKRKGKVKFIQEFELVDFKTTVYPTNVIGRWSQSKGLQLLTVSINEEPGVNSNQP